MAHGVNNDLVAGTREGEVVECENVMVKVVPGFGSVAAIYRIDRFKFLDPWRIYHTQRALFPERLRRQLPTPIVRPL
jgi:hypothetical protein